MASLREIPELAALRNSRGIVRIPPELDVPLTERVRQLIDTPEFCRLKSISQLGLVSLVYPAANHTRFEHSLGVYRLALLYWDTGLSAIRLKIFRYPKSPATNCSPTAFCSKARWLTRSATNGIFSRAKSSTCSRASSSTGKRGF